jgi:hypothetical protein
MPEASVHEHMGQRLPPMKEWRRRIEKSKLLIHEVLVQRSHDHNQHIDDYDALHGLGQTAQETSSIVVIIVVTHLISV